MIPQYPIYIPSKGRATTCYVANILKREGLPFTIAVEPKDADEYAAKYGTYNLLVIPENDNGVAYVRNCIKKHSISNGDLYHWQLDDNIKSFQRLIAKRMPAQAAENLTYVENIINNYKNIAVAGMAYSTFAFGNVKDISINKSPASGFLVKNDIDIWWRKGVPVDIDYTLQCLSNGWCSIVFNKILIEKPSPLTMKGGCTEIEYGGGKREQRTMKLCEYWPDYVKPKYKYGRFGLTVGCLKYKFKQRPIRYDSSDVCSP